MFEEEQDRTIPEEYEGTVEPNYYCRAWNSKREKYCGARAGKGTEHPGVGRCNVHDGRNIIHGERSKHKEILRKNKLTPVERYRELPTTIQSLFEGLQSDPDPLSIESDIQLARAILLEYVQRYKERLDALDEWLAWYQSENPRSSPPKVNLLPVEHVVTFLKKVTDIAHKERKLRQDDAVSLSDFYSIMGKMGKVVEHWVMQPDMASEEKLERIRKDWLTIEIDR